MSEVSLSSLYGSGVFTTIRIINGEPWLWEKHWRRLLHDSERLGIDISPYSEYMMRRSLDESIPGQEKGLPQKARITITDERPSPLWSGELPHVRSRPHIIVSPLRRLPTTFRLGTSPNRVNSTSPLAGLKTCNYLEPLLSLRHSMDELQNEAVRLNELGHVTSGCMSNIFWLRDGRLFTPALSTGCLAGTTRELVCESFEVDQVEAGIDELEHAEAIFMTSAGLGIVRVDQFGGRVMPAAGHAITELVPGYK